MKKSHSVNIGGAIFQVDEDAYERLESYLYNLQMHFSDTEGKDEIVTDIERRISEMLEDKLNEGNRIVTLSLIEEVIGVLGEPADFDGESSQKHSKKRHYAKRLYRNPDDKILGGVAGGIGAYFNIEPLWVRILFVLLLLLGGSGGLIYMVMWVLIPLARTTAEKFEMHGEELNIENIERAVKDEMIDIKRRFEKWNHGSARKKKGNSEKVAESAGEIIVNLIKAVLKAVLAIVGLFVIIGAVAILLGILVPGFTFFDFQIWHDISFKELLFILTGNKSLSSIAFISLLILVIVPFLQLIVASIRAIFNTKFKYKTARRILSGTWSVALIFCIIALIGTTRGFARKETLTQTSEIKSIGSDTLYVGFKPLAYDTWSNTENQICDNRRFSGLVKNYHLGEVRALKGAPLIEFREYDGEAVRISVLKKAKGKNHKTAIKNVQEIDFKYSYENGNLKLDPLFSAGQSTPYRGQMVKVIINLPKGKVFKIDDTLQRNHRCIVNLAPLWEESMSDKFLTLQNQKIIVLE